MLDVVGLKHPGRHGEQRDCDQPADLLSVRVQLLLLALKKTKLVLIFLEESV